MDDERYYIRWFNGNFDSGLTRGDLVRMMAENNADWTNGIVVRDGKSIGVIGKEP